MDNGFDLVANAQGNEMVELIEDLREWGLEDKEIRYCFYLLMGESNANIAKSMGCTIMTLCNMRKKLKKKLGDLALAFQ